MLSFSTAESVPEPLSLRASSWCLRGVVTALVLTGHLLPAGAAYAGDPAPAPASATETVTPQPAPPQPAAPSAETEPHVITVTPMIVPVTDPTQKNEWEIIIRPQSRPAVNPQPQVPAAGPSHASVVAPTQVNVHVTQIAGAGFQPYGVHPIFAEPSLWRGPTSAYLFDRPLPHWQLRSDFHHLRPFISRLR